MCRYDRSLPLLARDSIEDTRADPPLLLTLTALVRRACLSPRLRIAPNADPSLFALLYRNVAAVRLVLGSHRKHSGLTLKRFDILQNHGRAIAHTIATNQPKPFDKIAVCAPPTPAARADHSARFRFLG